MPFSTLVIFTVSQCDVNVEINFCVLKISVSFPSFLSQKFAVEMALPL